jgi:hypothetical protein
MAIVLHLLKGDQSWRVEGAHEMKLEQALGAKAKHAISEFKRSTDDPKWVLVAYDKHGAIAAVDEGSLAELKGKLGDFPEIKPEIKKALENPA